MDENLEKDQIIKLLDLPYNSEDEFGEVINENDIDDEINDEELFAKLNEVLTLPAINSVVSDNDGINDMPNYSPHNIDDSNVLDDLELQNNPVSVDTNDKVSEPLPTSEVLPATNNTPTEISHTELSTGVGNQQSSRKNTKQKITKNKQKTHKVKRPPQIWKHGNFELDDEQIKFKGSYNLPEALTELKHPYNFFKYFFNDELISKISAETLLYSTQRNPAKPKTYSNRDIERFLGIIIFSSISNCTSLRDMWHPIRGHETIMNCMGLNSFENMRSNLHFNDNSQQEAPTDPNRDRLYKLRPVIDHLNSKFLSIPMRATLSIDEQTCATKTKHYMRLYNPNKPHKWGYKLYVICDDKGFAYKFEIYTGQSEAPLNGEPDLGTTGNLVVRLAREVPRNVNYAIYCDNYYSSLPLFSYLHKEGIFMLGTFRRDRLPDCPFEEKSIMIKSSRGTCDEWITVVDDTPISVVCWHDNQVVTLGSTFCGALPLEKIKRYDRKNKKYSEISCPKVVKIYNRHMGGVDQMDSHIGRHHIRMKSKKWYFRLLYHLVDMAVVNAWILHSSMQEENKVSQKEFRTELAVTLCSIGMKETPKRGRPSSSQNDPEVKKRMKASSAPRPPFPVVKDRTDHWPIWDDKRNRCKMDNCKGNTNVKCSKCNLNLCFHSKKNCFKAYHT
ncbi:piggyBac transposable element-derived protein 2-like [Homalodisca vitripennis]|uniref:piggyBac transposable element-derived protein 2-like n=1 Tax=Homalodisca vitripennis TaxID=197043 RepID=UPI001EECE913|nr:piggyBac transposable element-derived protein 2-like [Homalodisca vitripennis]